MKTQVKADMNYRRGWRESAIIVTAKKLGSFAFGKRGFTLVELIVVCAVLGILATMAFPALADLKNKANISRCIAEIRGLEKDIFAYWSDAARFPNGLAEINRDTVKDPWGNLYVYYPIPDAVHTGAYKEYGVNGFLNDDFDLYSWGADGDTSHEIVFPGKNKSSDDVVRGGSGSFVELGSEW